MKDGSILSFEIMKVRPRPEQSADDVMDAALSKAGLSLDDIDYCISTGYGRESISFAQGKELSDITAAINQAMATRIKSLVGRIGIKKDVCFTGGVAKNTGVVKSSRGNSGCQRG